jgi:predicted enzyme related to lactoylglutathione lyase
MKVKALAFVGIPVTDMKRARAFYEGVLGLKVSEEMMGGKWVEYSLGNNTLAIASVGPQWLPSDQGTGAALEVENFDEAVESLKDDTFLSQPSRLKVPVVGWQLSRTLTGTTSSFTN